MENSFPVMSILPSSLIFFSLCPRYKYWIRIVRMPSVSTEAHLHIGEAVKSVLRGECVATVEFLKVLSAAASRRDGGRPLEEVSGDTVVIGPCRGHAADLAHCLDTHVLSRAIQGKLNLVFLGNYVDGGHHSVEVLYMLALCMLDLPSVTPLVGRHEMFYPFPPGDFGSLRAELRLRSIHCDVPLDSIEETVRRFFSTLPVACIINKRFFCSSSGIASTYRFTEEISRERSRLRLNEFVQNQPMNEEEDKLYAGCAFVGSHTATGNCLRYTHNALCNFLLRNDLFTHIAGIEFHASSERSENFMSFDRYRESRYLPGWMFGRIRKGLRVPSYIFLFSAPHFCDVNKNSGCILTIVGNRTVELQQLDMYVSRPLIMPGEASHGFAWSQGILLKTLRNFFYSVLYDKVDVNANECGERHLVANAKLPSEEEVMKLKYRRMCELVKKHLLQK
ncbi:hypothetical protein, conserved [Trypanosoma brucei brucei TREU927]|uniref:Serine/threonine specific protein phosphatases domain-containing protein n=2 Tax=Trypanozoon TaxID=39700 RepID=Q585C4_TRYB2|nr:hypothetical protein, conserved [Trypanosoma brucei brucei TREU927]AAX80378.1 hypothetical protein, conserved [Trypanosoma brucei]AAZ11686.1 hypothetical protein, conserved [Trypanosoma brucei brucei TREU927]